MTIRENPGTRSQVRAGVVVSGERVTYVYTETDETATTMLMTDQLA